MEGMPFKRSYVVKEQPGRHGVTAADCESLQKRSGDVFARKMCRDVGSARHRGHDAAWKCSDEEDDDRGTVEWKGTTVAD